jgi:hypothetical protein
MLTLMIMVGATWIMYSPAHHRPVQLLSAAAREIGAGHLIAGWSPDRRRIRVARRSVQQHATELAASRGKLERSTTDLKKN